MAKTGVRRNLTIETLNQRAELINGGNPPIFVTRIGHVMARIPNMAIATLRPELPGEALIAVISLRVAISVYSRTTNT